MAFQDIMNSSNSIASLNESLNLLQHRGPDDGGTYVDNSSNIGLRHRRLSIIKYVNNRASTNVLIQEKNCFSI